MSHGASFPQAFSADETASGPRSAALLLHAMDAGDRQWLMSQLSDDQRADVQRLLDELSMLGIPADRGLVRDALHVTSQAVRAAAHPTPDPVAALRGASVDIVCRVLAAECDQLIAKVLSCHPWPWHEALLAHIGAVRRQRINDAIRRATSPAGARGGQLANALLLGLQARVAAAQTSARPVQLFRRRTLPSFSRWFGVLAAVRGKRGHQ
jgi:hypothetical protein